MIFINGDDRFKDINVVSKKTTEFKEYKV